MNFIIWLIVGGIIGWLASIVMRTDAQQGLLLNIVVGIVGAVIAGLILGGVLAAPFAAYVTKQLPDQPMMILVGSVIILLSVRSLIQALG